MKQMGSFLRAALMAVLLPCVFTVFFKGDASWCVHGAEREEKKVHIWLGEIPYDLTEQEYLLGALAAAVPMNYEPETLKAVTVILRTNLRRMQQETERADLCQDAFAEETVRAKGWGADYLRYEAIGRQAVEATEGLVLKYEGSLIDAAFCGVSAGKTRQGAYPYLQSVESESDLESERFLTVTRYTRKELAALFPDAAEEDWEQIGFLEEEDTSYIKEVTLGETVVDGEQFRQTLGLCSSAYFGTWEDGVLQVVCKGQGHGLGFSCYGANELAKEGKTFEELLACYYGNIAIENE